MKGWRCPQKTKEKKRQAYSQKASLMDWRADNNNSIGQKEDRPTRKGANLSWDPEIYRQSKSIQPT